MTLAQDIAKTWRAERPVRWFAVDDLLAGQAEQVVAAREGGRRRSRPGLVILFLVAWIAPLIGLGMLVGTGAGRFDAAISLPGAAVGAVIGVVADLLMFRAERRDPGDRVILASWLPALSATAATVIGLLRAIAEQVDATVAVLSLAVLVAASAVLWIGLARRYRLPRVPQAARTEALLRNPVAEASMREDLAATVAIYLERGLISDEVARRALDLGPGRLAELDAKAR
jgi:hypothetical protein